MYLDALQKREDERKLAKDAAKQKYDAAWATIEGLNAEGWYKHDNVRQSQRDGLRNTLTEYYTKHGVNAFSGPGGQERQAEFRKRVADYEKFEAYSGQMQSEWDEGAKMIQQNPDKYDEESVNQFLAFKDIPYEEQIKTGVPRLLTKEEAVDWMAELDKVSVQNFTKQYGSTKIKPGEGVITATSGVSIREDDLKNWSTDYINSALKPNSANKGGMKIYKDAIWDLTEGALKDQGVMLDRDEVGEDGLTEFERKAKEIAINRTFEHQKRRIKTSYESRDTPMKSDDAEGAGGLVVAPSATVNNAKGESSSVSNVVYVQQTGGGAKDPKIFLVRPKQIFSLDNNKLTTGVSNAFEFQPVQVFDAEIFTKNEGGYKKGDIVPTGYQTTNSETKTMCLGNKVTTEKDDFGESIKTTETVMMPEEDIKGELNKHISGYEGRRSGGVDAGVFEVNNSGGTSVEEEI
jgi:hypothetical protein